MPVVVRSTFPSRKFFALQKHIAGSGRVIRIPAAADVYGSESAAIIEHVAHIRNASGVPTGKVTITSYLNANSAVFPSFVFVTVKLCQTRIIRTLPKRRYFRAFWQILV